MNNLKNKLTKPHLESFSDPREAFDDIAKDLLTLYVLQRGEVRYRLTDIEFYLYNDGHRDIITYPRTSLAGSWFFHPSGVDITFESHVTVPAGKKKPILTTDAFFGGILIRGIEKIGESQAFNGPMLACDELFDQFDAFGNATDFPKLVPCKQPLYGDPVCIGARYGLSKDAEKKVESILKYNYGGSEIGREVLTQEYRHFLDAPYHYVSPKRSK